jgi:hypothetical protein
MSQIIKAKIIDSLHLELNQPIALAPGQIIEIFIANENDETTVWRDATKNHFLNAYDEQDAIYDTL